jgi:hypothetical protein
MENYQVKINNLEIQIRNEKKKIIVMKKYIKELEEAYLNLESEYSILKTRYSSIASKESDLKNLEISVNHKNKEIIQLKEIIQDLKIKHEQYVSKMDIQYERDVNQVKYFNEANLNKIELSTKIEKLNQLMYNKILQLENIIKTFEKKENERMIKKEIEFEKKMNETKKRMLDYINFGTNGKRINGRFSNLREKLTYLNHKELMNELEFQSFQIEDLLKQREHLDKIILEYKNDVKIHGEIEKKLAKKNKRYTDIIKVLSFQNDFLNDNNINNSRNLKNERSIELNKSRPLNKLIYSNSSKSIYLTKPISSQKESMFLQKEVENYKNKYYTLKDRLDSIYKQFSNIINLLDETLDKIYNDNNFSKIKEFYINIDDFKKCDFGNLNPEQKYSIIVLIIRNLLPILNINHINNLDIKYKKIKTIFCDDKFVLTPKLEKNSQKYSFDLSKESFLKNQSTNSNNKKNNSQRFKEFPSLKKTYSLLKF